MTWTRSLDSLGMLRVAAVTPALRVADVSFNTAEIERHTAAAASSGATLVAFPELSLTGYTAADLFFQAALLEAAREGLTRVERLTDQLPVAVVVGLPLRLDDARIYNCAAFIARGQTQGIVPKVFLPTRREYYERRWFASGRDCLETSVLLERNNRVPFGTDLLFEIERASRPSVRVGIEICEDLWAPEPPSGALCTAGATVIVNPSASDEWLGKAEYRRNLVQQQSARCSAAYVYAASGPTESSTDVVFSGHSMIAENGTLLGETPRFEYESSIVADIDVQQILHERSQNSSFIDSRQTAETRIIPVGLQTAGSETTTDTPPLRPNPPRPFVPTGDTERATRCAEIFAIQSTGLATRLRHTGLKSVTLGLSGGLDSTLALLVTIRAFDRLGLDRTGIHSVTMPGFGTSNRTKNNATLLAEACGVPLRHVPIDLAVRQHFVDIGHSEDKHDITYENAQARERTQILMDLANAEGALVVGTGDLSELALGWCTYNADHMSMYHVNAGVPKTLVRYIVEWVADSGELAAASSVLHDICATPITPELLPLQDGELVQETEATVGPYDLHDFFLFQTVRHGTAPDKTLFLALAAWGASYDPATIAKWLEVFYRRFFGQQFKRSAMPDGPKVGSVALSPRGDWRMPSDASAAAWLDQLARARRAAGIE